MYKLFFLFFGVVIITNSLYTKFDTNIKISNPLNLSITYDETSIALEWDPIPGARLYKIYEKENPFDDPVLIDSTLSTNWTTEDNDDKKFYEITAEDNFIFVQGSTFTMGDHFDEGDRDELPLHSVTISDFYIDKYEVTSQEFCDMLNYAKAESLITYSTTIVDNRYGDPKLLIELWDSHCPIRIISADFFIFRGEPIHPVVEITWYGAAFYCNMRSRQEGLTELYDLNDWSCDLSGNGYRLATEAEWEYAARGGINWTDNYHFSGSNILDEVAWTRENADSTLHQGGTKLPNQLGIYDMSGNAFEWVNDWHDWDTYYEDCDALGTVVDPAGPLTGTQKVLRCGGWDWHEAYARISNRFPLDPLLSHKSYGFRIIKKQ